MIKKSKKIIIPIIIGVIVTVIVIISNLGTYTSQNSKTDYERILEEKSKSTEINQTIELNTTDYDELRYSQKEKAIVVFPIFTGFAYQKNGFYDYYLGNCDASCLTMEIKGDFPLSYTSSQRGFMLLNLLEYPYITDIDISKNPAILKKYDKVILLHNEYVTKQEFIAITNHPNVVYLYPNVMYAEINYEQNTNTMTLIRGHGYPNSQIKNGFDWKFDNSQLEYDTECKDWKFYEIHNGYMLNCYPEKIITENLDIIRTVKRF